MYLSFGSISCSFGSSSALVWSECQTCASRFGCEGTHQCAALDAARSHGFNNRIHLLQAGSDIGFTGRRQTPWHFPVGMYSVIAPGHTREAVHSPQKTYIDGRGGPERAEHNSSREEREGVTCDRGHEGSGKVPTGRNVSFCKLLARTPTTSTMNGTVVVSNTPPTLNGHAVNGGANDNGAMLAHDAPQGAMKFTSGLILPPPEVKCASPSVCRVRALYLLHADLFISALPLCSRPPTLSRCARTAIIDRTALFVARSANPPQFEDKIRENQRQDPKFSFLNPADPYHAYYRHRMDKVVQGELDEDVEVKEAKGEVDANRNITEVREWRSIHVKDVANQTSNNSEWL